MNIAHVEPCKDDTVIKLNGCCRFMWRGNSDHLVRAEQYAKSSLFLSSGTEAILHLSYTAVWSNHSENFSLGPLVRVLYGKPLKSNAAEILDASAAKYGFVLRSPLANWSSGQIDIAYSGRASIASICSLKQLSPITSQALVFLRILANNSSSST